jgi:4-hydroxybenzoate polyprenyltransferase
MKKLKRSTIIPILLLIYLAVMAYIGWPAYASGQTSALQYFGIIVACILVITLLHFTLKKRENLNNKRNNQ